MLEAKRTLVKSAPELWAEVSDPASLARHLAAFGSIRITSTQPDALVTWEGERGSGGVRLEPSGFGTRVTLMATTAPADVEPDPAPTPAPPEFARSLWARLFRRTAPVPAPAEPAPAAPTAAAAVEAPLPDATALVVLTDMLDALGRANHRPFSRA